MTWGRLVAAHAFVDHDPAQVRLVRELHAVHRAGVDSRRYYYGGEDKTIDLAEVGGRLWSFLDEAAEVGLPFGHARKRLGAVEPYGRAVLGLDVTAGDEAGSLAIAPVLQVEGHVVGAMPVLFLGAEGTASCTWRPTRPGSRAPPSGPSGSRGSPRRHRLRCSACSCPAAG